MEKRTPTAKRVVAVTQHTHTGRTTIDTGSLQSIMAVARRDALGKVKAAVESADSAIFGDRSYELECAMREYIMHAGMQRKLSQAEATIWRIDLVYRPK